jgi:hypothetical protein
MSMTYTLVRHSAWTVSRDPQFKQAADDILRSMGGFHLNSNAA